MKICSVASNSCQSRAALVSYANRRPADMERLRSPMGRGLSMRKMILALFVAAVLTASSALAGPIMHVHDSSGNLGTVDVTTGSVTVIGNMATGQVMTDIAFDPFGNLFGASFNQFFAINAATAAATFIGSHNISG